MAALNRENTSLPQKLGLAAFGFFLAILVLEGSLRLGGSIILSLQDHRNALAMRQKGVCRIMCIGESTTQGTYPAFLEQALNGRNLGIRFSVIDRGLRGAKSAFLVDRMEADLETYHPDMVVAMMGINDDGPHMPYEADTRSATVRLIRTLRTYKLARIAWLHLAGPGHRAAIAPPGVAAEHGVANRRMNRPKPRQKATRKPCTDGDFVMLGYAYSKRPGGAEEAVAAFNQALRINPRNGSAYVGLGWAYDHEKRFSQAREAFRTALQVDPASVGAGPGADRVYDSASTVYLATGKTELARQYHEKAEAVRLGGYDSVLMRNYLHLKELLDRRRVRLICVQYPMRALRPLRNIFQGRDAGIIFVDNEQSFRDAVKKSSFQDYFRDLFAGDFGHCSDKGNRLLASNIADALAREVFGK